MSAAVSAARARGAVAWAPPLRASRIVETMSALPARRTPRTCVRPATFTRALNRVAVPLPAAVPDFGPLNEHFVRDIGSAFAMLGIALLWGAARPGVRLPVLALVTLFNAFHAVVHVWDTSRGLVGPEHWRIDFPAVYLPTLVLVALTITLARGAKART